MFGLYKEATPEGRDVIDNSLKFGVVDFAPSFISVTPFLSTCLKVIVC